MHLLRQLGSADEPIAEAQMGTTGEETLTNLNRFRKNIQTKLGVFTHCISAVFPFCAHLYLSHLADAIRSVLRLRILRGILRMWREREGLAKKRRSPLQDSNTFQMHPQTRTTYLTTIFLRPTQGGGACLQKN